MTGESPVALQWGHSYVSSMDVPRPDSGCQRSTRPPMIAGRSIGVDLDQTIAWKHC